jgi:hypothetical protein
VLNRAIDLQDARPVYICQPKDFLKRQPSINRTASGP